MIANPALRATLVCAVLAIPAFGQQEPDREFRPPIGEPVWATGEGPTVCVDAGHHNFHTIDNRFWAFGELLRRDGYQVVSSDGPLSAEALEPCAVMVISNAQLEGRWADWPYPTPSGFEPGEIEAAHGWVKDGGALLLIADHMPLAGVASDLAARFGVLFNDGFAVEGVDPDTGRPTGGATLFRTEDGTLRPHAIQRGRTSEETVTQVRTFTGQAFRIPKAAESLLLLPESFVSLMPERAWQFDKDTRRVPVGKWHQAAVLKVDEGRAAFFGEAAMFTAQVAGPQKRPMGMNSPMAEQNYQFVLNVLHWLTGQLD